MAVDAAGRIVITAVNLQARRGTRTIIDTISMTLSPGEVLGVMGANGAGKSTLLALLSGELAGDFSLSSGSIKFDGIELAQLTPQELARRRAVLPQAPTLSFDLDVSAVVAVGAYPFPEATPHEVSSAIIEVLDLVDAAHLRQRRYLHLSGGEQQRVHFARVLLQVLMRRPANEARYLFLDEPTASLDPRHQQQLMRAAATMAHSEGLSVLAVLHDVNLAARWCDRLLMLADGKAIACGSPMTVLTPNILRSVYHAEAMVLAHPNDSTRPLVLFE